MAQLKVMVYLDVGVCALKNETEANTASNWVKDALAKAGWVCNEAKSVWAATHKPEWPWIWGRMHFCAY